MNDYIRNQVYAVLGKYHKSYQNSGVTTNLEQWKRNKGWLIMSLITKKGGKDGVKLHNK